MAKQLAKSGSLSDNNLAVFRSLLIVVLISNFYQFVFISRQSL